MKTQFDPQNNIIQLCMQGMSMAENGKLEDANELFFKAWQVATDDFEKFIAAYFVAKYQNEVSDKLSWLEKSLQFALKRNDESVMSAFSTLYSNIAQCHEALGNSEQSKINSELANRYKGSPTDKGPFYHGTRADLQVGDLLIAGGDSNYQPELKMNHIYFTALINGAGLAAALAKGEGIERIYIVEPTGEFENDPNVTDKKFPGNLSRSYRSLEPLKIVGEETEWVKQMPDEIRHWREKLAANKGEIIN